jgi:hypothetical protein
METSCTYNISYVAARTVYYGTANSHKMIECRTLTLSRVVILMAHQIDHLRWNTPVPLDETRKFSFWCYIYHIHLYSTTDGMLYLHRQEHDQMSDLACSPAHAFLIISRTHLTLPPVGSSRGFPQLPTQPEDCWSQNVTTRWSGHLLSSSSTQQAHGQT